MTRTTKNHPEKKDFRRDFHTLSHILRESKSFLLAAHTRPDPDTIGAVAALFYHLREAGKDATIVCANPFDEAFSAILPNIAFSHPDQINIPSFDVVIAADSVERGFSSLILPKTDKDKQITIVIDHHPDIDVPADVTIIDSKRSSTCEILSEFFFSQNIPVSKCMATALLLGILGDTGNFQHANTSARVLEITSKLLARGASIGKISSRIFANKKLSTLRLWGRAFEKARMDERSGMMVTALTKEDLLECEARAEDVSQVANMLATVPGAKYALILAQHDDATVKGSFRAESSQNVDVSEIARRFGGGGHPLASGFEIRGKLVDTSNGWSVM